MSLGRDIEIPDILRPNFPAPANARLSLGLGIGVLTPTCQNHPTSTIKLISKPFPNTDFNSGAIKNGKPQPLETKSVFVDEPKAGKRARKDSDDKNGKPQLQPFETTFVFVDSDGKNGTPQLHPFKKRARMDSEGQLTFIEGAQKKSDQRIRLERAQEAIRKKLEANRARRRSSAAHGRRKSGGITTGRPIPLGKPKPKPSRFGFLSSTKSLVQSVWNRGKVPEPAIVSNIPKPTVTNVNVSTKSAASKAKVDPPPGSKKRSSIAPAQPTTASGSRIPFPVKNQRFAGSDSTTLASANSTQPTVTGRKPHISRSKVIARLAFQKAAGGNGNGMNATRGHSGAKLTSGASNYSRGRTRSSLGAKAGGKKSRAGGEGRVLSNAKRRAKQGECARRKSKIVIPPLVLDGRYPVFTRGMNVSGQAS